MTTTRTTAIKKLLVGLGLGLLMAWLGQALPTLATAPPPETPAPILLRGRTLHPATEPAGRTPARQATATGRRLVWLQFDGPIRDDRLAAVKQTGLRLVQYVPNNAYLAWASPAEERRAAELPGVAWQGDFSPADTLHPALHRLPAGTAAVTVTIQLYNHPQVGASRQTIRRTAIRFLQPDSLLPPYRNMRLVLPAEALSTLAALPDVVNIEPWQAPRPLDEVQNQLIAGAISGTTTTGPGYLPWLTGLGFPTDPAAYPVIDITDDGVDNGTITPTDVTLFRFGAVISGSRFVYAKNCTTDAAHGIAGHGHLNASIAAGYNAQTGFPHVDADGYQLGQGVNPFGQIASTRIFNDADAFDLSACGSFANLVRNSYNAGARISSNSWGSPVGGQYTVDAQTYDMLARDALTATAGNQQMLFIFAAGNDGPTAGSIGAPGTAKNVITVGASENIRADGVPDGCGHTDADSSDDMAAFSSRGPTADGRTGIDTVAPGTHIQGTTPLSGYTGSNVCGAPGNTYYPITQTTYTWSSGTSHAAPAVAGAASLVHYWLQNRFALPAALGVPQAGRSGSPPSPAMTTAFLLAHTRHMTGLFAADDLPSPAQGLGAINLRLAFDDTPRILLDQTTLFDTSGQVFTLTTAIANPTQPLRIALAWTDAPGATIGAAYVNDLNLEATVNSQTYRGNNFSGGVSVAGGSFDAKNNVELIVVPAGASGPVSVRVLAANIAGDGVPGTGDSTDQDFALVCTNCRSTGLNLLKTASPAAVFPGDLLTYTLTIVNNSPLTATGLTVTDTVPAHTQFVGAPAGGLVDGGAVVWQNLTVPASGTLAVRLVVRAGLQSPGQLIANADYRLRATDGTTITGNAVQTPIVWPGDENGCLAGQTVMWADDHEDGDADWSVTTETGSNPWQWIAGGGTLANHLWFVPDAGSETVSALTSPPITVTAGSLRLRFRHHYTFDYDSFSSSYYDGGVVEVSVNGGVFTDASLTFEQNGYNGVLYGGNPLGGRTAFVGAPFGGVFTETVARLDGASVGDVLRLRWRQATDFSGAAAGWFVDDVSLVGCSLDSGVLRLSKSARPSPAESDGRLTYTLRVSNTGPVSVTYFLTDTIPPSTTFAAIQPPGVRVGDTVGWGFDTLPPGETLTYSLAVTVGPVLSGTVITNARYGLTMGGALAGSPVTVTVRGSPRFSLTKTASNTPVWAGNRLTYTLRAENFGTAGASVTLTDTLPASVTLAAASDGGAAVGDTIVWPPVLLGPGQRLTRTLAVTVGPVLSGTVITNAHYGLLDSAGGPNGGPPVAVTVWGWPDLRLEKTARPLWVEAGQPVTYIISYGNAGLAAAPNLRLTDTLPAVLSQTDVAPLSWGIGTLEPGQSGRVTVTAIVSPQFTGEGWFTNTAVIGQAAQTATAAIRIVRPALGLGVQANASLAEPGQRLTFTYRLSNTGSVTLTGLAVVDDRLGAVSLATDTLSPGGQAAGWLATTVATADMPGPLVSTVWASGTSVLGTHVSASRTAQVSLAWAVRSVYLPVILK